MNIRLPLVGTRISDILGDPTDKIRPARLYDAFTPDALPPWRMELVDGSLDLENGEAEYRLDAMDPTRQQELETAVQGWLDANPGVNGLRRWANKPYIDQFRKQRIDPDGNVRPLPAGLRP